jgi:hypothetical protein
MFPPIIAGDFGQSPNGQFVAGVLLFLASLLDVSNQQAFLTSMRPSFTKYNYKSQDYHNPMRSVPIQVRDDFWRGRMTTFNFPPDFDPTASVTISAFKEDGTQLGVTASWKATPGFVARWEERHPRPAAQAVETAPAAPLVAEARPDAAEALRAVTRRAPTNPNALALVIGIERHATKSLPPVDYARHDAETVAATLQAALGIPAEQVLTLTNEQATAGAIRQRLGKLRFRLDEPEKADVYLYFAGHGLPSRDGGQALLLPYDGDPSLPETCLPLEQVYDSLSALKARSTTVFLDACFSGTSGRGDAATSLFGQARPAGLVLKQAPVPPGVTVLAAAAGDQLSGGFAEKQHGLFTWFLLEALRGQTAEGPLTLQGLYDHVRKGVRRQANREEREQVPTLTGGNVERVLVP